jgi:hypothetical protein
VSDTEVEPEATGVPDVQVTPSNRSVGAMNAQAAVVKPLRVALNAVPVVTAPETPTFAPVADVEPTVIAPLVPSTKPNVVGAVPLAQSAAVSVYVPAASPAGTTKLPTPVSGGVAVDEAAGAGVKFESGAVLPRALGRC